MGSVTEGCTTSRCFKTIFFYCPFSKVLGKYQESTHRILVQMKLQFVAGNSFTPTAAHICPKPSSARGRSKFATRGPDTVICHWGLSWWDNRALDHPSNWIYGYVPAPVHSSNYFGVDWFALGLLEWVWGAGCAGHSRSRGSLSSWSQPDVPMGCRRAAALGIIPALTPPQLRPRHREGTRHSSPGHSSPGHKTQHQPMQVTGSCSARALSWHRDGNFWVAFV